jgi:hypothetical protein
MRKYVSEAMQVLYEDAEGMFEDGVISAEQFHEFDDCLVSEPVSVKPSRAPVPQYASPTV